MECGGEGVTLPDLIISTYIILRSAINSLSAGEECSDLLLCEGGMELRREGGEGGRLLADMGGELLGERRQTWLSRGLYEGVCGEVYDSCHHLPHHYRHPGVSTTPHHPQEQHGMTLILNMLKTQIENFANL